MEDIIFEQYKYLSQKDKDTKNNSNLHTLIGKELKMGPIGESLVYFEDSKEFIQKSLKIISTKYKEKLEEKDIDLLNKMINSKTLNK